MGLGIESCTGNVADGAAIDTSKIGYHTFTVTATDKAGNITTQSVEYVVNSTAVDATRGRHGGGDAVAGHGPGGLVRRVHAGRRARVQRVARRANVISTAGDARAERLRPGPAGSSTARSRSPQPLQVSFSKAAWTAPVSNDPVTISFRQAIGANEALRTGTYSKTLTFTLSTTTP